MSSDTNPMAETNTEDVAAEAMPPVSGKKEKKESTYVPYRGPLVTSESYSSFKSQLDRQNAQRRHKAHLKGLKMYRAKVLIPEKNGVKAHYVFVEKFVNPEKSNGTGNK